MQSMRHVNQTIEFGVGRVIDDVETEKRLPFRQQRLRVVVVVVPKVSNHAVILASTMPK